MFTDTHFHLLEMEKKGIDCGLFLKNFSRIFESGMDIGIMPSDLEKRIIRYVYPDNLKKTSGIYPGAVENRDLNEQKELLEKQSNAGKIDAIGEAGLDWHWNYGTRDDQINLFCWQLELAESCKLPLVIHNREADSEMLEIFESLKPAIPLILHCYSSDRSFAEKALKYNCFFSFSGNITYKNAENIREACSIIPVDRLLTETDSPYLAPVPHRGKTNTPPYVEYVINKIAEIKKIDQKDLEKAVSLNFRSLFS